MQKYKQLLYKKKILVHLDEKRELNLAIQAQNLTQLPLYLRYLQLRGELPYSRESHWSIYQHFQ